MKIAVVGIGYVGLVTGTCLADYGNDVYCVDVVEEKIANLKKGIIPIYEPGLESLVRENQDAGRLIFTTNLREALYQPAGVQLIRCLTANVRKSRLQHLQVALQIRSLQATV